jgi:putative toxin-antitoxin system antitoxin component (TIGR02293 family)
MGARGRVTVALATWRVYTSQMAQTTLSEMDRVVNLLGGPHVLRSAPSNRLELIEVLREGLPYKSLTSVLESLHFSTEQAVEMLALPRRTLSRRQDEGRFNAVESERVARLARVASLAIDVFEDLTKAVRWLTQPSRPLGNHPPVSLLDTDIGAQAVEEELLRIEHGFFA